MRGRKPKPAQVLEFENRHHKSKEYLETRKDAEFKLGSSELKPPRILRGRKDAQKKFRELVKLYEGFDFVSSADVDLMARYCITYCEYIDLVEKRRQAEVADFSPNEELEAQGTIVDERNKRAYNRLWRKIEWVISLSGILNIDKAINSKLSQLQAMDDRLFLNPMSRLRTVGNNEKKEDPNVDTLEKLGFGYV